MKLKELINILSQDEYKDALEKDVKLQVGYMTNDVIGCVENDLLRLRSYDDKIILHAGLTEIELP